MPLPSDLVDCLPPGSVIQEIAYTSDASTSREVLLTLPAPINRRAVLLEPVSGEQGERLVDVDLTFVTIPSEEQETGDLLTQLRQWVDTSAGPDETPQGLMMTLQGAQVFWSPTRVALIADSIRLVSVRKALIEVTYYLSALNAIESELREDWPDLEEDLPLAFRFDERSRHRLKVLQQRSQRVLSLRARLARITPFLLCPHVYPPTLASQLGERLRERTHVSQREETLSDQLEVFEDVYEMCSQRSSDFSLARTGHMLEWLIIVLLLTQVLMSVFDLLSNMGS